MCRVQPKVGFKTMREDLERSCQFSSPPELLFGESGEGIPGRRQLGKSAGHRVLKDVWHLTSAELLGGDEGLRQDSNMHSRERTPPSMEKPWELRSGSSFTVKALMGVEVWWKDLREPAVPLGSCAVSISSPSPQTPDKHSVRPTTSLLSAGEASGSLC